MDTLLNKYKFISRFWQYVSKLWMQANKTDTKGYEMPVLPLLESEEHCLCLPKAAR